MLPRMGIALGEGALRPAGTALIAEMFQAEHRAVANGLFSWGVGWHDGLCIAVCSQVYFGYGLSFIFGIYLTQLDLFGQVRRWRGQRTRRAPQGWRATYVLAGLPGLVVAVPLGMMVDPREGAREARCRRDSLLV
jgi:MFS family permease